MIHVNHFRKIARPKRKPTDASEVQRLCFEQRPKPYSRFTAVIRRTFVQSRRDRLFMLGRLLAYICTSALVGILFQFVGDDATKTPSNLAFLFIMSKIFMLGSCIVTVMNSRLYLQVLLRENINSWYGVSSFYLSRTLIEACVNICISLVFSTAMWLMSGQQQEVFPTVFIVACLMSAHCITTHHFSFILAMFCPESALPQLPFAVTMLNVLFAGYFVPLSRLPLWISWMQYVNFGSFTYTALVKLAYGKLNSASDFVVIPCKTSEFHPLCQQFKTGEDVLRRLGMSTSSSYWLEIAAVASYAVALAIVGWCLIAVYLRKQKRMIARL